MVKRIGEFLQDCFKAMKTLYEDEYTYKASALAFTTLLSLVPIVSVCVYILTHLPIFSKVDELTKNYVINNFLPQSSDVVITYFNQFLQHASSLPIFSILFLFITAMMLIITVNDAMTSIWESKTKNHHVFYFLIYAIIVLFIPIFIGFGALISNVLVALFNTMPEIKLLGFMVPLVINTLILMMLYMMTSKARISWINAFLGSIITALLLNAAKFAFSFYINLFSNYQLLYGALATFPVFLLWLYIFWLIILYGAVLVKTRFKRQQKKRAA